MIEISREKPPETAASRPSSAGSARAASEVTAGLEKGSTIEGTVVERRGGFDIIDVGGQALKARSANPLPQGADVRLEVLQPGSPVQVRLVSILTSARAGAARQAEALTREMLNVRAELAGMHSVFSRLARTGASSGASDIQDSAQAHSTQKALAFLLRGLEQGADPDPARNRAMAAIFQKQGSADTSLLKQIMTIFRPVDNKSSAPALQKGTGVAALSGETAGQGMDSQGGGRQVADTGPQAGNITQDTTAPAKTGRNQVLQAGKTGRAAAATQSGGSSPSGASQDRSFTPLFPERNSTGTVNSAATNPVPGRSGSTGNTTPGGVSAGQAENASGVAAQPPGKQSSQQMPAGLTRDQPVSSGAEARPSVASPSASRHNHQTPSTKVEARSGGGAVSTHPGSRSAVSPGSSAAGGRGAPLQPGSSGTGAVPEHGTAPSGNTPSDQADRSSAETAVPGSSPGHPSADKEDLVLRPAQRVVEQTPEIKNDNRAFMREQGPQAAATGRNPERPDAGHRSASPVHADAGAETVRRSSASTRMETGPAPESRPFQTAPAAAHHAASDESGTFRFFNALASHGESVHQYQQQMQDFLNTPFFMIPLWFENGQGHGHWSWWSEDEEEDTAPGTEIQHLAFDLELANLGRINIHILRDSQGISLHAAASREILPMLRAGMQELRDNLEAMGFHFSVADIFPIEEADVAEFLNPAAQPRQGSSTLSVIA